jgi:hypothetical protein
MITPEIIIFFIGVGVIGYIVLGNIYRGKM